ncbi:unnamed protein product, partial [Didymodactylos carnosus]
MLPTPIHQNPPFYPTQLNQQPVAAQQTVLPSSNISTHSGVRRGKNANKKGTNNRISQANNQQVYGGVQIIHIERIQNKRWFKQYCAHKEEFNQRLGKETENWLFHGCSDQAAINIQQENFSRNHAGIHGTVL